MMSWLSIANYLLENWIEVTAVITTILGIWFTTRRMLLCWPITFAADILYFIVFFRARLYSDTLLQIFFLAFTLYGWWHWWHGVQKEGGVRVVPLNLRDLFAGLAAGAAGALLLGWLMVKIGAALPHLDATLASYSLVASYWQARKHTANWWLWIAVDLIYIGEYIYKGLWPTAALYVGLVALAALGLRNWQQAASNTQVGAACTTA